MHFIKYKVSFNVRFEGSMLVSGQYPI